MPVILGRGGVWAEEKELTQRAQRKKAQRTRRRERRDGERRDGERRDGERRDGERRDGERRDGERRDGERRDGERRRREKNGSEDPPLQRNAEDANREIGVPRKCSLLRNGRERAVIMVWGAGR